MAILRCMHVVYYYYDDDFGIPKSNWYTEVKSTDK